ncbi:hypothetical protein QJS10_CPA16g01419 [Acorus calamus]|uniref:Response regulatory domain-containing protein n=1 Tax=Acorus calamus TaxID=4465 RepID=A0AAV9D314_ACOCL|nr:hypothetical protein QJS10_CPA16g01419 [Acorus calamus]
MGCADSKSMKQVVIDEPNNNNIVTSKGNETIIFKNKLRALIVDDNCVNRKILKMMLKSIGVESQEVENGQEAVDLFVAGAVFDVVLIDKEMPIMDGPEATKVLRSMGIRSKMVGVSGNTREEEIMEFMDAGLNEDSFDQTSNDGSTSDQIFIYVDNNPYTSDGFFDDGDVHDARLQSIDGRDTIFATHPVKRRTAAARVDSMGFGGDIASSVLHKK